MKIHSSSPQAGNMFLYILVAVALFAALSLVFVRSDDTGETNAIDRAQLKTTAQRLLTYVNQTSDSWLRMRESGTDLDELDLTLPSAGTFNNDPTIHKLFHPDGGGLLYRDMNEVLFRASTATPVGWAFVKTNADWSVEAGDDLILTYLNLKQSLCAEVNRLATGSTTIPTVTVNFTTVFSTGAADLTAAACPECETHSSLCVENAGIYAFYNMIEMR
jgi:hypothetical protein